MQDSVSRFSLRFKDRALEANYARYMDRNRALFVKYIYSFMIIALSTIFVFHQLNNRMEEAVTLRIFVHILTLLMLRLSACCYPQSTGYLGYVHITVYFVLHSIFPESTLTTTLRTLMTGTGLYLISATLIDSYWLISCILYSALTAIYWIQHSEFLDTAVFDYTRVALDSFLLIFVIGYSSAYFKRMMFHQTTLLEASSRRWLQFLQQCPDPIVVVGQRKQVLFCNELFSRVFVGDANVAGLQLDGESSRVSRHSMEEFVREEGISSVMLTSFPRSALFNEHCTDSDKVQIKLVDVLSNCFGGFSPNDRVYTFSGDGETFWFSV